MKSPANTSSKVTDCVGCLSAANRRWLRQALMHRARTSLPVTTWPLQMDIYRSKSWARGLKFTQFSSLNTVFLFDLISTSEYQRTSAVHFCNDFKERLTITYLLMCSVNLALITLFRISINMDMSPHHSFCLHFQYSNVTPQVLHALLQA